MEKLDLHIEALVFTAEQAISLDEIESCLEEFFQRKITPEEIESALTKIRQKYQQDHFSFELVHVGGGFQFLTKSDYHEVIGVLLKQKTKKKLTRAALETLSIIAYKQPITRTDIEAIRGVNCDYSIQKLLEKELVTINGRSDGPGKPLIYCTSAKFMDYFGLNSMDDLPKLKDFKTSDNEIGESQSIEEDDEDNYTSKKVLSPINEEEE